MPDRPHLDPVMWETRHDLAFHVRSGGVVVTRSVIEDKACIDAGRRPRDGYASEMGFDHPEQRDLKREQDVASKRFVGVFVIHGTTGPVSTIAAVAPGIPQAESG